MLDLSVLDLIANVVKNFLGYFIDIILRLPGVIIAVTVHGFAQALIATAFGDKGPKKAKKLSLDPITHTEPIGFLSLLLFRFGWAAPVSINTRDKKYPRLMRFLAILAGPCANLLLAFVGCLALIPLSITTSAFTR